MLLTSAAPLLLLLITLGVECAIPEHEVVSLPGWSGELPTRQYSGYIPVNQHSTTGKQLHYWLSCKYICVHIMTCNDSSFLCSRFVESESDPANDPVVLWLVMYLHTRYA